MESKQNKQIHSVYISIYHDVWVFKNVFDVINKH